MSCIIALTTAVLQGSVVRCYRLSLCLFYKGLTLVHWLAWHAATMHLGRVSVCVAANRASPSRHTISICVLHHLLYTVRHDGCMHSRTGCGCCYKGLSARSCCNMVAMLLPLYHQLAVAPSHVLGGLLHLCRWPYQACGLHCSLACVPVRSR